MKNSIYYLCLFLFSTFCTIEVKSQSQEMIDMEVKRKLKEFKKAKWEITGTSKSADYAIGLHFKQISTPDILEIVGESSDCANFETCKKICRNNAQIELAQQISATIKGKIESGISQNSTGKKSKYNKALNLFLENFKTAVSADISGILNYSYSITRESKNGSFDYEFKSFFFYDKTKIDRAIPQAASNVIIDLNIDDDFAKIIKQYINN